MSSNTTKIRDFIESFSHYNNKEFPLSIAEKIERGRKHLFDFDYPFFNNEYRKEFETHFIRNFYMREIGFEVFGLFKFHLETWMMINMPYWNKMFESELIKYNPLINTKMDVTHSTTKEKNQNENKTENSSSTTDGNTTLNGTNELNENRQSSGNGETDSTKNSNLSQNGTSDTNVHNFNRDVVSETPENRLAITTNDGTGVIEYASEITEKMEKNQNNSTNQSNSESNGTENANTSFSQNDTNNADSKFSQNDTSKIDSKANKTNEAETVTNESENFVESREGKIGSQTYAKMIEEYRDSLLRIENMIFREMEELFMLIY